MPTTCVVGILWGDEGKGKVIDYLAADTDFVVRFGGGHNAGHTLVLPSGKLVLHLIPSGIVHPHTVNVIGNGVVVDPVHLCSEIDKIRQRGIPIELGRNLLLSERAHVIVEAHRRQDQWGEALRGSAKIGTTGRGIGPAYEDKIARRALRVQDLKHPERFASKLRELLDLHNFVLTQYLHAPAIDFDAVYGEAMRQAEQIRPMMADVSRELNEAHQAGANLLFEGAQGTLLDVDHGTYPFVTSSNTMPATAAIGGGAGIGELGFTLGITKAYSTRVGHGPYPTELFDEDGETLGQRGKEFGTTTGRKRRCGWFDAVMVRQAVELGGVNGLALTKLDVLDSFAEIKLCTGYRLDGQDLDHVPTLPSQQARLEPVYEVMEGWQSSTEGARSWKDLPALAIKYIRRIEELVGCPIALVSTSPKREDVILVQNPFGV